MENTAGRQSSHERSGEEQHSLARDDSSIRSSRATAINHTSSRSRPESRLPGIELRESGKVGDDSSFVVGYEGPNDSMDPHNWSYARRIYCTMLVASIALIVSMASAVDSSVIKQAAQDFGVSKAVESMATGLFLIAFGFGALFAGPVSETLGRNPVYVGTLAIYMIFIMTSALAPNIGAQLAFRFIAGFFGSTPLICAGGTLSDL